MQVEVDCQVNRLSRLWRYPGRQRQHEVTRVSRYLATTSIGNDLLVSGNAMQCCFVLVLDAGFSGMRSTGVVRHIQAVQVIGRQCAHIAERVRGVLRMRIMTYKARLKIDAGKTIPLQRKPGNLIVAQPKAQRNRLESRTAAGEGLDSIDVVIVDQSQLRQPLQGVIDVSNLLRNELKLVGRQVLCQYSAPAIKNEAANRRHSLNSYSIALGLFSKNFVIKHLQLHQPRDHHAK